MSMLHVPSLTTKRSIAADPAFRRSRWSRLVAVIPDRHRRTPRHSILSRSGGMTARTTEQELIRMQQLLLDSIANRDWNVYTELCDETLTAFEPEAVGHLVEGLPFHKFYFDFLSARQNYKAPTNVISQPHVRLLGDTAAVVTYVRLQQKIDSTGRPITVATEETRVWEKKAGKWKNVHFHRSPTTPSS